MNLMSHVDKAMKRVSRSSINTYIYIFPHNLCKINVF